MRVSPHGDDRQSARLHERVFHFYRPVENKSPDREEEAMAGDGPPLLWLVIVGCGVVLLVLGVAFVH
jgi:hypothetical protein